MVTAPVNPEPQTPVIVHRLPGRTRVHLPLWTGKEPRRVAQRLRALPGVTRAEASALTKNALLQFDPALVSEAELLAKINALQQEFASYQGQEASSPPTNAQQQGATVRARIAVRGMDRDPKVAQRVVERLPQTPGVRAKASPLTGRVLVEFSRGVSDLDDLVAQVSDVELPDTPGEDRPADPLDPKPVIQSALRVVGSALGLSLVGLQQLPGFQQPLVDPNLPATVSGVISILRGFPFVRNGLRRLLGQDYADILLTAPNIAAQALAGSPLGLAVSGAESVRLLTEARARQAAWRSYAERLSDAVDDAPGSVIRLESGERAPRTAQVIAGVGTCMQRSGAPLALSPGQLVPAGARVYGGPFTLELRAGPAFEPQTRPAPSRPTLYDRYVEWLSPISVGYALVTAGLTLSVSRTFAALLLVSPRTAVIGMEAADLDVAARVVRAGITIVGTRPERSIRRPDLLLLDGPRLITTGYEVTNALALSAEMDTHDVLACAGAIASAVRSPWGGAFRSAQSDTAENGHFDGHTATADLNGVRYSLEPISDWSQTPEAAPIRQRGDHALELRRAGESRPLGIIALRPRLMSEVSELVEMCQRARVELLLLPGGDEVVARGIARRAGIGVLDHDDALQEIRSRQARGDYVAYVSDGAHAAAAFDACDLAIGLTTAHTPLPARADVLAFELGGISALVRAGVDRERAVRDAVGFSIAANLFGAVWGFRGQPGIVRASQGVYVTALAALADGWLRLRGGDRPRSALATLTDPRPERWGQRSVADTLDALSTTEQGLTSEEAAARQRGSAPVSRPHSVLSAATEQLRSPLTAILGVGAGLSLVLGAPADVAIIAATIAANVAVGVWQERKADQVSKALERLSAASARVLRDGAPQRVPATEVVPVDILLLGSGDRVTADARLIEAQPLEVDEAALTGESLPALKTPVGGSDASRVLLDGSDVISGAGRAVAFAVGRNTRMGTITAALSTDETKQSPLNARLSQLLGQVAPLAIGGGAIVVASGFLRTRSLVPQLAIGAAIALTAVPEGLPLLTQVSEAGVARRLAERHAVVRRLPSVESLGRVDIVCSDKTGTLTEGKLALRLIADTSDQRQLPDDHLPVSLRDVLLAAALASPNPDAPDASSHPTDIAVISAAEEAGVGQRLREKRESETPFDPMLGYHATKVNGRLYVKGAPEVIIPRCVSKRVNDHDARVGAIGRQRLLERAQRFAEQGLRVLVVAEGSGESSPDDPQDLTALGFLGIKDPLKGAARAAVRRCREAGVKVMMLTGDHPATAAAIAREAGLLDGPEAGELLTGAEIAELQNGELDARLERATVIARATPLDKLRIIESLQRHGHVVAMTGDGVNDAPALRLADVGVAMGVGGAEVARQTADVVIADDNFATLVDTFVEGRSFWRNIRRAIGLLLGGNLGELGMVVGATALGFASPLTARQALVVNAITDILPGLAIGLQQPETRRLSELAREGASALDKPLWYEVGRRGALTGAPSLLAYLAALRLGGLPQARAVAFASVVGTQLVQTLDMGWSNGKFSTPVLGSVAGSAGMMALALGVPSARAFLGLAIPSPAS
ncbi:MAG TPA: HAD-IC family P-type ATPase, partial [Ktedonobacterales bacterium]|nr:HAD-IC family P-type ATPase [Ktedonobacterales bacterium]